MIHDADRDPDPLLYFQKFSGLPLYLRNRVRYSKSVSCIRLLAKFCTKSHWLEISMCNIRRPISTNAKKTLPSPLTSYSSATVHDSPKKLTPFFVPCENLHTTTLVLNFYVRYSPTGRAKTKKIYSRFSRFLLISQKLLGRFT